MGINSYITHRMFVAALNHDEVVSEKNAEKKSAQSAKQEASKVLWDVRFKVLNESQGATPKWAASSLGGA
jgi:hypothetical protein